MILLESSNLEIERNLSLFAMMRFLRGLKPVLPALTTAPVFLQQRESQSRAPLHRPGILYFQCFAKHGFFIKSLFKLAPVGCMEPELPSDEDIFNAMRELYQSIPDASLVTVRMLRERTSEKLGLGPGGLDDKKDLVKAFMEGIINDEAPPEFDQGSLVQAPHGMPAVPVPMTYGRALAASSGMILRKLPKPRFAPYMPPNIDLCDLTIKDFHAGANYKHVVDIITNHDATFTEADVKKCLIDGELENLPAIAKPPPSAIPVNHFAQIAFVEISAHKWHVVKLITFISASEKGMVKGSLAATYRHGEMHAINFGSNNKDGKRVFQYLFQELGGFQIRQWELQSSSAPAFDLSDDAELRAIDRGFDFIEKSWRERSIPGQGLKQLHWVTRQVKDPNSPLFGSGDFKWNEKLINQAIIKLREEGALAKIDMFDELGKTIASVKGY